MLYISFKTFGTTFLIASLIPLGGVAAFNFYMDPLWMFPHSHEDNDMQVVIDERQQKANHIHYANGGHPSGEFNYDTLLIGSSRSTYINPNHFENMDVYNFAAADLSFKEYDDMIQFAKQEKGSDFERIIIGVDFFKSSKEQSAGDPTWEEYLSNLEDPFYRAKSLTSSDVLDYSLRNYRMSQNDEPVLARSYNRDNTAFAKEYQASSIESQTQEKIQRFRDVFYGDNYEYNPEFKAQMQQLKENNPNTEFIIFTTPISTPLFETMEEEGNLPGYEQWLKDIIDVFGGVHHFMYPNFITNDVSNYFDGHHFYPEVGTLIAETLSTGKVTQDFGTYMNASDWFEAFGE